MSTDASNMEPADRLAQLRDEVRQIRQRAANLLDGGANGIQAAAAISDSTDKFLVRLMEEAVEGISPSARESLEQNSAIVAIGGSGRGDCAPYSDVDVLFLHRPSIRNVFVDRTSQVVRDCWDAGIKLGHSTRTIKDTLSLARQDVQVATSLVEARSLWGSSLLVDQLKRQFYRRVIHRRRTNFIDHCIAGRENERQQHGAVVQHLEPDIKRSLGGLRDLHLVRWISFALFETTDIQLLRLKGIIAKDDARHLLDAHEFLTRIRMDLHFEANRPQEVLTRAEQLRIAERRKIKGAEGQRPVERLMQDYFRHSTLIAEFCRRFASLHRPKALSARFVSYVMMKLVDGIFELGADYIHIDQRHRAERCRSLKRILKIYKLAAEHRLLPSPLVEEQIALTVSELDLQPTSQTCAQFMSILEQPGNLGALLRSMYSTGVLEVLIPEMTRVRCLLQFNQYHSYTVDEHTLRTIESIESFESLVDDPLGTAYGAIKSKSILHLALLLHDAGKGFEEDHSDVGRRIATTVAERFGLADDQREILCLLVHKHLLMAHTAFRRDTSDPATLFQFSHEIGSPETLRMLYVMTAADITAVGPGIWTEWKANVMADLYDDVMQILSGKHYLFLEQERLNQIKHLVRQSIATVGSESDIDELNQLFDRELDSLSPHYLTNTRPARIAADLDIILQLSPGDIVIEGRYEAETRTLIFRVITDQQYAAGCSHRIAGVLTAKRLEILSAQITTSRDGIVVDSFCVIDNDFEDEVPQSRIDDITDAIRRVVRKEITVKELYKSDTRFGDSVSSGPYSDLKTHVVIDNDSSDRCTIVDIFAHDQPGLMYTICRTAFKLDLSIQLAKISTHLDQVVDVLYVTDMQGRKIEDRQRLRNIREVFENRISEFQREGHLQFVA